MKLLGWFYRLGDRRVRFMDRRRRDEPVEQERRRARKPKRQETEERLLDAVEDLERTVRMKRDDFLRRFSANDIQTTVIFSTYRDICPWKGPEIAGVRFCRHRKNRDFEGGETAICDEEKCPTLDLAIKGQAA